MNSYRPSLGPVVSGTIAPPRRNPRVAGAAVDLAQFRPGDLLDGRAGMHDDRDGVPGEWVFVQAVALHRGFDLGIGQIPRQDRHRDFTVDELFHSFRRTIRDDPDLGSLRIPLPEGPDFASKQRDQLLGAGKDDRTRGLAWGLARGGWRRARAEAQCAQRDRRPNQPGQMRPACGSHDARVPTPRDRVNAAPDPVPSAGTYPGIPRFGSLYSSQKRLEVSARREILSTGFYPETG